MLVRSSRGVIPGFSEHKVPCAAAAKPLWFATESARQSLGACTGRKVRAPAGRVPGNAWGARAHGKCHRKYTASYTR